MNNFELLDKHISEIDEVLDTWIEQKFLLNYNQSPKTTKKRLFFYFQLGHIREHSLITYPVFGGFAVNAIMNGDVLLSLSYSLLVLIIGELVQLAVQ